MGHYVGTPTTRLRKLVANLLVAFVPIISTYYRSIQQYVSIAHTIKAFLAELVPAALSETGSLTKQALRRCSENVST